MTPCFDEAVWIGRHGALEGSLHPAPRGGFWVGVYDFDSRTGKGWTQPVALADLDQRLATFGFSVENAAWSRIRALLRYEQHPYQFAPEAPSRPSSQVYFIRNEVSGAIKIGTSKNVAKRLARLKTSSPDALSLMAVVDGDAAEERALHERFAAHRLSGEWFAAAPELLAHIEDVRL